MRRTRALPILTALILILAACGTDQGSPSAEPDGSPDGTDGGGGTATGGTVRIGLPGYPDSLHPGLAVLAESYTIYELVYDTPITVTADGEYVAKLATDWTLSDDGLTWTVTLRDDATFHDGEPLDADDLAFSVEFFRDNVFPLLTSYAEPFVDVNVVDATTVELTTEEEMPEVVFNGNLYAIYVLPEHIWADEDPQEFENAEMVGSGPFTLVEATKDESVELAANPDYWATPPAVDGVIFQTITNADARITALTANPPQIDALSEFPATALPALQNAENVVVNVAETPGGQLRDIFFNVATGENCPTAEESATGDAGVCNGHPALKDVTVRQALAHATNKEQLIQVATLGTGSPGLSLVTTTHGDFLNPDLEDYAFDTDEANRLLDDAGYDDTDGDGVRECLPDQDCPTGDLTFRLYFPDDSDTAPREAEQLQDTWNEIGVAVQIQGLDPQSTLTSLCCPGFDYDIIIWSWYTDIDAGGLLGVATCAEVPSGFNETGYCNPEYDELFDAQAVELDRDTRIEQIHELQRILMDDVVYIVPYYFVSIQAWRTDTFTGWIEGSPTLGIEDPGQLVQLRPNE